MAPLSSKEQKRIVAQAQQAGTLGDLYWMIELDVPLRFGGGKSAVKLEDGVPLIPVGPDVETSSADAELLRWGLEWINLGNGYRFHVSLTDKSAVAKTGAKCYIWGEETWISITFATSADGCIGLGITSRGDAAGGRRW